MLTGDFLSAYSTDLGVRSYGMACNSISRNNTSVCNKCNHFVHKFF